MSGGWRPSARWAFAHDPWWVAGVLLQIVGYAMYSAALRERYPNDPATGVRPGDLRGAVSVSVPLGSGAAAPAAP